MSENLRAQTQNGAVLRGEGREEPLDLDAMDAIFLEYPDYVTIDTMTAKSLIAELRRLREENARLNAECDRLEGVILQKNAARDVGEIEATERLTTQIKALVDRVEDQRWIPVGERLPEDECDVLVWSREDGVEVGHYNVKARSFVTHGYYTQSVAHWRPLPAPPEVKP